jgi:hypothetical protein
VTVNAKPSVWRKIGGWFGREAHAVSYAATVFVITHSKLALESNKSGFEYWNKQSNEDIIKSLNPGSFSGATTFGSIAAFGPTGGDGIEDNPLGPTGPEHNIVQTFTWTETGLCHP